MTDRPDRREGIALPDGTPSVMLRCDAFPMPAVWAHPAGPFICLESRLGRSDEGFRGSLDEKKAVQSPEPGTGRDNGYSIEFL